MGKVDVLFVLVLFSALLPAGICGGRAAIITGSETAFIDVYTQKELYSGKGVNNGSDSFAPGEEVVLYASVEYNQNGIHNKLVSFEVRGPVNAVENVTISRTSLTNENGVANISFRVPWPEKNVETIVFGVWIVHACVEIGGEMVEDMLTFEVGWIVEIVCLRTVDEDFELRNGFMQGTYVVAELTVENIAMTAKNVTLAVAGLDSLDYVIGVVISDVLQVEAGEMQIHCVLYIPEWSACGNGTLHATARKPAGGTYCPAVSVKFGIILFGDLNRDGTVDIRDIGEVARAYGSYEEPEHPRWNPDADINNDGVVDIRDVSSIARRFGETCK